MKKIFLLLLIILPTILFAQTNTRVFDIGSVRQPNNESLSASPTTLSGFSAVAGTQGASQNYTLTGANLSTNVVTVTAPANFVVSKDNSTFSTSVTVTPSAGSVSQTIYVAIANSATVGSVSGNVGSVVAGLPTVNVAVSGTVTQSAGTVLFKGTSTSVSSLIINLSSVYTTYDYYRVYIYGVTPVTNGSDLLLTFSTDGSTYNSSSYSWKWENASGNNGSNSDVAITILPGLQNTSGDQGAGMFIISGTNAPSFWIQSQGNFGYINNFSSPITINSGGALNVLQVTKAFKLAFSAGNIATISYKVIGFNN